MLDSVFWRAALKSVAALLPCALGALRRLFRPRPREEAVPGRLVIVYVLVVPRHPRGW
jgi:hypothetical protein